MNIFVFNVFPWKIILIFNTVILVQDLDSLAHPAMWCEKKFPEGQIAVGESCNVCKVCGKPQRYKTMENSPSKWEVSPTFKYEN